MNKKRLISEIQLHLLNAGHELTKDQIDAVLAAQARTVAEHVGGGEEVTLPHIGTLAHRTAAARSGRNPRTGERIEIPARHIVHFKPCGALKSLVRGG